AGPPLAPPPPQAFILQAQQPTGSTSQSTTSSSDGFRTGNDHGATTRHFVHQYPPGQTNQAPKLPPRPPPPPPPTMPSSPLFHDNKVINGQQSAKFPHSIGSSSNITHTSVAPSTPPPPPPPPPLPVNPPFTSSNNSHATFGTLNQENVSRFNAMMNQPVSNSTTPPPPPPPPRGVISNNQGGTTRRPPTTVSDFLDNTPPERRYDQGNTAALDYDRNFENRFRFTPIEHLPPPGSWKSLSATKT
ncbi:unnamed protein product, partial [Rotaria magnacalcarata]